MDKPIRGAPHFARIVVKNRALKLGCSPYLYFRAQLVFSSKRAGLELSLLKARKAGRELRTLTWIGN
jgi:hypothetical protein